MQEARNEFIRDNLPKLIKALTNFEDDDENIRHCEQYAWSIIRNHRYLSTNSHEVRRMIEAFQEKFRVDNQPEYANHFHLLSNAIIQHPQCAEHYEVDVQWSLMDFLMTLAYNPTGALRRNQHEIDLTGLQLSETRSEEDTQLELLKEELREDLIPTAVQSDSDSELSDWSDSEEAIKSEVTPEEIAEITTKSKQDTSLQNIKPPEKTPYFVDFNIEKSKERLQQSIQHSWWLPVSEARYNVVNDGRMESNFATIYSRFMSETSHNLIRFVPPETMSEYYLLREVLWMFFAPRQCKFFTVTTKGIQVRDNVSVNSVTVNGLASFLETHFLPYMRMMQVLREFIAAIYTSEDFSPPKTLELYTSNLDKLLQPLRQQLSTYERRVIAQNDCEINTIIDLHLHLRQPLSQLAAIHSIHQQCVLNLYQTHAHISSAYLLTSLLQCNANASSALQANLSMALFLTSVKAFCIIIDTWWTEGRLDDWQQEFLVENNGSDQTVRMRQYRKDKERAFFVPAHVTPVIEKSAFFRLLSEHTLEAGYTLNLLYAINRINDLRHECAVIEDKLYNVFIADVRSHVHTLQTLLQTKTVATPTDCNFQNRLDDLNVCDATADDAHDSSHIVEVSSHLTTHDEFLLLAFSSNNHNAGQASQNASRDVCDARSQDTVSALQLFKEYEQTSPGILPLEQIVLSSLARILKSRIASANSFVMRLYCGEYDILRHLGNIRKILLLEASDLMHQFYVKLFKQIESGHAWSNPYLLTMQLDDAITSKYANMSSLFRLEIDSAFRCQTTKVFEAVDELIVTYSISRELAYVITADNIDAYNRVFRFLLKVKWGLATLESLQFPRSHRRRAPYAPFQMVDYLMRRLEQLRLWILYDVLSIHSHLLMHVMQSMGGRLDEKIAKCQNLNEMKMTHESYIRTLNEHCFQTPGLSALKMGVEQLLNLVYILRMEWNSCVQYIESTPLAADATDDGDDEASRSTDDIDNNYVANAQIEPIELTYVRCHEYLAHRLKDEVYLKQKIIFSGLSQAFNTCVPC